MTTLFLSWLLAASLAQGGIGDPQTRTDHPWYPGELSCSTFERLFATQAELYKRATGAEPKTDQDKALAAWYWRNLNYWHGEEGTEDLWGKEPFKGEPPANFWTRDYWTGLFSHGFGLCYTSHVQWGVEMDALLGRCRGRGTGVKDHYSFEVFLDGRWVLLDHDISTVVFSPDGSMLSTTDLQKDLRQLTDRTWKPERQKNWPMCSYVPTHGQAYQNLNAVAYDAGYGGPPPMVHLRRGETFRRYVRPGLEDGKTFVYWGRNYQDTGIPGPARGATWVNQPEKFYGGLNGSGWKDGRARYANAVFTYRPNFASGDYREGVVAEGTDHVVFEFSSPYVIAAAPAKDDPWAVYDPGCTKGLVLSGKAAAPVSISVDRGRTWKECGTLADGLDLTDHVKGRRQYLLRLGAGVTALAGSGFMTTTVCQSSSSTIPRLKDGGTRVRFQASHQAVTAAGPTAGQAKAHLIDGDFQTPSMTFELATPRGERPIRVHAAAMVDSWNPPRPVVHTVESSTDGGKTWTPFVKDWKIVRREPEAKSFGTLTYVWGAGDVAGSGPVRVRFRNDKGQLYFRAEVQMVYETKGRDATRVTFDWTEGLESKRKSHDFPVGVGEWLVETGRDVETRWVEYEPVR